MLPFIKYCCGEKFNSTVKVNLFSSVGLYLFSWIISESVDVMRLEILLLVELSVGSRVVTRDKIAFVSFLHSSCCIGPKLLSESTPATYSFYIYLGTRFWLTRRSELPNV